MSFLTSAGPILRIANELGHMLEHAPERVLWGTDFPHPNHRGPVPDDGDLVDLLASVAPDPAALSRLLVDNPAELFGFSG